jgi:glyoxylase I family protein
VTTPAAARLHHIALTVRDLDASVQWYRQVFAVRHLMDAPHEGGTAQILVNDSSGLLFALHTHDEASGDTFCERRTGLDHVGLVVDARDDLVRWQDHLEQHGVRRAERADRPLTQSPIADEPYGSVLVFRDPDNIQLELLVPATS